MKGYFGIGIYHPKTEINVGTLWRSASILGASFIFTIGKRYKQQSSDTLTAYKSIPLYNFKTIEDLIDHLPYGCPIVGVELDEISKPVKTFDHPERCAYLLGAEDHGLTKHAMSKCHYLVQLYGEHCYNVAVAGSLIMYDRLIKQ